MKTGKWGKTILALLLAVMMILPSAAAMADPDPNEKGVQVKDGVAKAWDPNEGEQGDWAVIATKLEGDLAVKIENELYAVDMRSFVEDSSFEVTGSVRAETESENNSDALTIGVYAYAAAQETSEVEIGEDVVAEAASENGKAEAYGIRENGGSGNADINVAGDVQAVADSENGKAVAYGINLYDPGNTDIHVAGDVEASASGADYADARAVYAKTVVSGGGEGSTSSSSVVANVIVDGKAAASAKMTGEEGNSIVYAVDAEAYGEGAETNVTIGKGAEGAVQAFTVDGGTTNVAILEGGVKADDLDFGAAVSSENYGGSVDVKITGGVTATGAYGAVDAQAYGKDSETVLVVDGDVSVTNDNNGFATAVGLAVQDEASITATITGEKIEAFGSKSDKEDYQTTSVGVYTDNAGGDIDIDITADVSATGADVNTGVVIGSSPSPSDYEYAIDKDADPVMINVDDVLFFKEVQIGEKSVKIYTSGGRLYTPNTDGTYQPVIEEEEGDFYEEGNTNLTITGDVAADDIGVAVELPEVQTANITIDGTVSGQTAGIVLKGDTQLSESVTMTVWEVIPNKDNVIVVRESEGDDGKTVYTQDEEAEKLVQYIIRIKDDSVPYIAMYGTTDFTAGNGEKYKVAYEGDTVLVRLNIPDGKELVGAYWDVDQKGQMLVDPDTGEYYVEVPRGGGVQLSLVMKDIPKPANNNVSYCMLKFFEDKDAAAKNVTVAKGHTYTLPAAPEKEGRTFVGWAESAVDPSDPGWKEPAEGDASILAAGTEYKVTENKSFVGIWK